MSAKFNNLRKVKLWFREVKPYFREVTLYFRKVKLHLHGLIVFQQSNIISARFALFPQGYLYNNAEIK